MTVEGGCNYMRNAFKRWIIVHPSIRTLAWTGSTWEAIDPQSGFSAGTAQVCNFATLLDARRYVYQHRADFPHESTTPGLDKKLPEGV